MKQTDRSQPANTNPYRSPLADASAASYAADSRAFTQFRLWMRILGSIWLGLGLCMGATATVVYGADRANASLIEVVVVMASSCALCFLLGVAICLKQLWAAYLGMVFSYLALVGMVFYFMICPFPIVAIAIIAVSHIAIWKAHRMRSATITADAVL
jgi:hypothetical protein